MRNAWLLLVAFWHTLTAMAREIRTMPKGYLVVMVVVVFIGNLVTYLLQNA